MMRNMDTLLSSVPLLLLVLSPVPPMVHGEVYDNGYCPLLSLLPFSVLPESRPSSMPALRGEETDMINLEAAAQISYSLMASSQLAMEHFNARDSSIVPELSTELLEGCSVEFPSQLVRDTGRPSAGTASILEDEDFYKALSNDTKKFPCAIVGPENMKKSLSMKDLTTAVGIPQMLYFPRSGGLGILREPSTLGMSLTLKYFIERTLSYLVEGLGRNRLAIYHGSKKDSEDYGKQVAGQAGDLEGVSAKGISSGEGGKGSSAALKEIKDSGVRTILIDVDENHNLAKVAEDLDSLDMLDGGDYFFVISTPNHPQYLLRDTIGPQQPGSALDRLLVGALVTDLLEPVELYGVEDKFLQSWRSQNGTLVEKLNAMVPMEADHLAFLQQDEDYFQTTIPSRSSSIVYDTVISIGLGACRLEKEQQQGEAGRLPPQGQDGGGNGGEAGQQQQLPQGEGPPPSGGGSGGKPPTQGEAGGPPPSGGGSGSPSPPQGEGQMSPPPGGSSGGPPPSGGGSGPPPPKLPPLNAAILATSFHGASGLVNFVNDRGDKVREQSTLHMGAYNIRPGKIDPDTGLRTYSRVLTSVWKPETEAWEDVEGVQFLYADGTTVPPTGFVVTELNVLYPWVRAVGLSMAAVSWFLALSGGVLTWYLRKHEVVRRVQPKFQILVCIASAIMTTAIFTLSFDEGAGWSQRQLEVACAATPWFFILGQVVAFSALFTKLWMLDRVLQFKRRKIAYRDHIWLPLLLFVFSVSVLIVWTVKDPWIWVRELISTFPLESYGQCKSNNFWAYFGPLISVLLFAQILTVFFALKTNDVPSDFRDSNPILFAIAAQIQAWVLGMLILAVLGNSSVNATYFGRVILIWTFAVSSVVIVVWPRLILALRLRRDPSLARNAGDRVHITGITSSRPLPTYQQSFQQPSSSLPLPLQPAVKEPSTVTRLSSTANSSAYDLYSTTDQPTTTTTTILPEESPSETLSSPTCSIDHRTSIASIDATGQIERPQTP